MKIVPRQGWLLAWSWFVPALGLWGVFCLWVHLWTAAIAPLQLWEMDVQQLFLLGALPLVTLALARCLGWHLLPVAWARSTRGAPWVVGTPLLVGFVGSLDSTSYFSREPFLPELASLRNGLLILGFSLALALFLWLLLDSARHAPASNGMELHGRSLLQGIGVQLGVALFLFGVVPAAMFSIWRLPAGLVVFGLFFWNLVAWSLTHWLKPPGSCSPARWRSAWWIGLLVTVTAAFCLQATSVLTLAAPDFLPWARMIAVACALLLLFTLLVGVFVHTRPAER